MPSEMTFEERNTWGFAASTLLSYAAYVAVILQRASGGPLAIVAWVRPMLVAIGAGVAGTIALSTVSGLLWRSDCDRRDARDREIHRFGEYVGNSVVVLGGTAAIALSMLGAAHFWIANAVYLAFVLSALLASATKLVAYRRGFQPC